MIKHTPGFKARRVLSEQLKETKKYKKDLNELLSALHIGPGIEKCSMPETVLGRLEDILKTDFTEGAITNEIIDIAKCMEVYKCAGYIVACTYATELGYMSISKTLQKTLDEIYVTDQELKAMSGIRNIMYSVY